MFIVSRVSGAVLIAIVASGCANFASIYRDFSMNGAAGISIDAKQRVIVTQKQPDVSGVAGKTYLCAEPSPDAIQAISAALSGSASYQQFAASLAASLSESTAYVGLRTQTIQLLRDAMYRVCEAHLSGSITDAQYYRLQDRFRRSMVTLAAIEQLTGSVRAPAVVLGGTAQAGTGGNLVQAQENLQKGIEQETAAVAAKKKAEDQVKSDQAEVDKAQAALKKAQQAGNADEIAKAQKDLDQKQAALKTSQAKLDAATKAAEAATKQRQLLESAVAQAQKAVEAATSAGPGAIETIQTRAPLSDVAVRTIATTVEKLVKIVYADDERTQLCLEYVIDHPASNNDDTANFCATYLKGLREFYLKGEESPGGRKFKELFMQ